VDLQLLCDYQQSQLSDMAARRDANAAAGQRAEAELEAQVALGRADALATQRSYRAQTGIDGTPGHQSIDKKAQEGAPRST